MTPYIRIYGIYYRVVQFTFKKHNSHSIIYMEKTIKKKKNNKKRNKRYMPFNYII